jgi:Rieske Fe-S protein
MLRRVFLGYGLMLVGFGRRVWAQLAESSLRYAPLSRPIRIPLESVSTPWQLAPFTAEAMAPATAKTASRRVLISGVVYRRPTAADPLTALCLTCPHEQCKVDLITDPDRLAKMIGGTPTHPLFECGCHSSVFDAQDGARVSGETPRGLYRFRITNVTDSAVEIGEIEEIALFEV